MQRDPAPADAAGLPKFLSLLVDPLRIVTTPCGDALCVATAMLARHTAALRALRYQAETELAEYVRARVDLEALIERLISGLDLLEEDPDLEPTMGYAADGYADEAEGDSEGHDTDLEPSLGWSRTGAIGALDSSRWFSDLEAGEVRP